MDVMRLLFSSDGRLGPKGLWTGLLILVGLQIALNLLVFVAPFGVMILVGLASFILIWPLVSILAKRFHDANMSGWLAAAVIVAMLVLGMVLQPMVAPTPEPPVTTDLGEIAAFTRSAAQQSFLPTTLLNLVITGIIGFAMASLKATPDDNKYGPPPAV